VNKALPSHPKNNLNKKKNTTMNTIKITVTYQYFFAEFRGWNGSNSRQIAEVSGCWDNEKEAEAALGNQCDALQDECDDDENWLRDYQRTTTNYRVTASLNDKLEHDLRAELMEGEKPDWTEADILATLDRDLGEYEIEFVKQ